MPKNVRSTISNGQFDRPEVTEVYFYEEETVAELLERVIKVQGTHVCLVIPPAHPALRSAVAMTWLAGECAETDKDVVVDMEDPKTANFLEDCGFDLLQDRLPDSPINDQKKKKDKAFRAWSDGGEKEISPDNQFDEMKKKTYYRAPHTHAKRRPTFLLWAMLTVAAIAVFLFTAILPKAVIVIIPVTDERTVVKAATVDITRTSPSSQPGEIRGHFTDADAHVESTTPITELSQSGNAAHGSARITNQTGQEITISKGTVFTRADGVAYQAREQAIVPPAVVLKDNTIQFGAATVILEARERGEKGNADAGRLVIQSVPEHRRDRIYAEITTPFTGGSDEQGKVVREGDVDAAMNILAPSLRDTLLAALSQTVGEEWVIDAGLARTTTTEVVILPPLGSVADEFSIRLSGRADGIATHRDDLIRLFGLTSQDCEGSTGGSPLCVFSISSAENWDESLDKVAIEVTLRHIQFPSFDTEMLADQVKGMSVTEARRLLLSVEGIKDARLDVKYSLRSLIPKEIGKIDFVIEK